MQVRGLSAAVGGPAVRVLHTGALDSDGLPVPNRQHGGHAERARRCCVQELRRDGAQLAIANDGSSLDDALANPRCAHAATSTDASASFDVVNDVHIVLPLWRRESQLQQQ